MYFGAHVKSSGGVWNAIENGVDDRREAVQFFAGSPRTWAPTVYKDKDAAQFREARAASPIRFVVIHTIYLINLASDEGGLLREVGDVAVRRRGRGGPARRRRHRHAHRLAPGRRLRGRPRARAGRPCGAPSPRAKARRCASCSRTRPAPAAPWASTSTSSARSSTPPAATRASACASTRRTSSSPASTCARREGWTRRSSALDAGCGLERLVMLHLNDSKTPLGSNRDRHENIGEGDLGMDGFRTIVNEPAFADLPGILEVPGFDGQGPDKENLARLRGPRG